MADAEPTLQAAARIMVIDWPSRDVPDTLVRAGYTVFVKGAPTLSGMADNYAAYELHGGEIVPRRLDRALEAVDLVYAHRPIGELRDIAALARQLGATAVWLQSGMSPDGKDPKGCWMSEEASRQARGIVEAAGLAYIDSVYIADAVRARMRGG